jgi:hypothetical protein
LIRTLSGTFLPRMVPIHPVVLEKKFVLHISHRVAMLNYVPQPCWITDRNESNNTWLDHANEHSCQVWSHLLQWFSRRRLKCLRTDDGCQVMAIAHVTLRVRWAKNTGCFTYNVEWESHCCLMQNEQFFSYIMGRTTYIHWNDNRCPLCTRPTHLIGFL